MSENYQSLIHASLRSIKKQVELLNNEQNINELEVFFIAERINTLEQIFAKYLESSNA